MRFFKIFIGFIILTVVTIFATANVHKVKIYSFMEGKSLIGYEKILSSAEGGAILHPREIPVFLVIYAAFAGGFLFAGFISISSTHVSKRQLKKLNRALKEKTDELEKLRNLPVNDASYSSDSETTSLPFSGTDPGQV
jgi:uncharacterized integral membrane protein